MISVSENSSIFGEKRQFYKKKTGSKKVESLQVTIFDLNQTWERVFTEKLKYFPVRKPWTKYLEESNEIKIW